jgi:flagellar motor switch protein FliN/FliY
MTDDAQEPKRAMSKDEIDDLFNSEDSEQAGDAQGAQEAHEGADEAAGQATPDAADAAPAVDLEGAAAPDLSDQEDGPEVQPVEFDKLTPQESVEGNENISLLLDVKLPITVELGRTQLPVKEILEFGPGSIIELSRLANEPVDLLVNGVLVARGEVVVIDDHFGVRLSTLISPQERIRSLAGGDE